MDSIFDFPHPFVCTDATVFTMQSQAPDSYRKLPGTNLRILLYKRAGPPFAGQWCLPGGFLGIDEMPEDNIRRKLLEKSQVDRCWLEQLYTFCGLDRDPRARVISITYLGLMNEAESKKYEDGTTWFTLVQDGALPLALHKDEQMLTEADIGFDHYPIILAALERLRSKILYSDIAFHLLPEEFTLTHMQNVYEAILGKKDQAANFRRKIMDTVQETGRYAGDKGHRPAKLYRRREGRENEKTTDRD